MSTHAAILMETEGGYVGIYCHWDGYRSGVGATLKKHYSSAEKVSALLALGDISSLGKNLAPTGKHSFDNPEKDCTVVYHRDRNEDWDLVKPRKEPTIPACLDAIDGEYVYVFTSKNVWMQYDQNGKMTKL